MEVYLAGIQSGEELTYTIGEQTVTTTDTMITITIESVTRAG